MKNDIPSPHHLQPTIESGRLDESTATIDLCTVCYNCMPSTVQSAVTMLFIPTYSSVLTPLFVIGFLVLLEHALS